MVGRVRYHRQACCIFSTKTLRMVHSDRLQHNG
jgi:hypothetical protein